LGYARPWRGRDLDLTAAWVNAHGNPARAPIQPDGDGHFLVIQGQGTFDQFDRRRRLWHGCARP
jgi:hypothetical protein